MPTPKYAQHVPRIRLVQIVCRGKCGGTRYAEVSNQFWTRNESSLETGLHATFLKCGYRARDNYYWLSV